MSRDPSSDSLHIDFHLDLICPWCWIGLRNLRVAWTLLSERSPGLQLHLNWHADTLLPQIPEAGIAYQAFYEARLGGPEAVAARRAQVRAAAQQAGLALNFEAIAVFPNSRKACALVNLAQDRLPMPAMLDFVESLFAAYFQQGRDIGDTATLLELAHAAGLEVAAAELLERAARPAMSHGGGVPHYVFNRRWPVTGAVPAAELLQLMMRAAASHA